MQSLSSTQKRWTMVAVAAAVFVTAVDNTVVNVALPSIQRDLGLGQSALEWIVNGYILAFAGLLLTGGKLGDVFGRKRAFLGGLAIFILASLLGGVADSETLLVAARAVQGVGAALMTPATLAIVSAAFPEAKERGRAIAAWAAAGALGFAVGPVVGGALAQHVHWSWIFWVNVPVGLAALLVGRHGIVESRDVSGGRRIDLPGVAISAAGLFSLTYALIEANGHGWTSPTILGLLGGAALALLAFVVRERRASEPMLDLSLFRGRVFAGGNLVLVLAGFGLFGIFFFLSLFLQGILGLSAVEGGLAFLPMAAILIAVSPASAKLAERFDTARVVTAGMVLLALGLYLISNAGVESGYLAVLPGLMVAALGSALTTPLTTAVLSAVPTAKAGIASGAVNTSRELAGSLGIAVIGAILAARQATSLAGGATPADAFVDGYSLALTIAAAVILVGAAIAWVVLREPRAPATRELAPAPV
jgi:EmrB/QacA subfamily drug resistance transporter